MKFAGLLSHSIATRRSFSDLTACANTFQAHFYILAVPIDHAVFFTEFFFIHFSTTPLPLNGFSEEYGSSALFGQAPVVDNCL